MRHSGNILITGVTSIHGWPIFSCFREKYGFRVHGVCPHKTADHFTGDEKVWCGDVENFSEMETIFKKVRPEAVVHAGGVCDLDMCEEDPGFAYEVNVVGARNIARLAKDRYLLYISSDLVFSGDDPPEEGYREACGRDPVSVIGKTYAAAEDEISKHMTRGILRLGLPIGASISGAKGAIDFIAKRLSGSRKMTLFHDEVRSLITTEDLAEGVMNFFDRRGQGVFHLGGPEEYSLYDIGAYLVAARGYPKECLVGASRLDEKNGPPRIGRVTLDSAKFYGFTGFTPSAALPKSQGKGYK
ncbi:SDR family oxidoreductase [Candidatus Omnitrophota bacterium]